MNRAIRKVSVVAALMFFALLANLTLSYYLRSDSLLNNPNNRRVREAEYTQPRGAILVSNSPIAQSKASTGRFSNVRSYANGPLYAPVTGFYSYSYGRNKLEQAYNSQLTGRSDSQFIERMIDSVNGRNTQGASLQTTINAKAQQAASTALKGRRGAVVAMDWSTGAILAYVSSPSYDPNDLTGSDVTAVKKAWDDLQADPANPMSDRAGREIYPPGSVFKLVTAAAALESGWTPLTEVASPATLQLPQTATILGNVNNCGGERVSMNQALQVSCNTAFANIGMALGGDALRTQAAKFGFNSRVTSDVNSVASRFPQTLNIPQTAMSAIGQFDVAATPLQMAMVAAGIANGGAVMEPYLVSEVRNADLSVLSSRRPTQLSTAMSPVNARTLAEMMINVVNNGSGRRAQVAGVRVGGKTGTAQSDPSRPNYAWFTGFAEDPKVAITVFVEDAAVPEDDINGGRVAAPVFKTVLEALR